MNIPGINTEISFSAQFAKENEEVRLQNQSRQDALQREVQGDLVTISDEAKAVLEAKMKEFDANTPTDLSRDEREDIKQTLQETDGVTEKDLQALADAEKKGQEMGPPPREGGPPPGGPGGGGEVGRKGPPPKKGGGDQSSDAIDDIEDNIAELEEEIEELRAKAANDESAKEELKAKQIELSLLQAELALEEQKMSAMMK